MGLFKNYVSQTRKPEGFLGKMMLGGMNSGHAKLADWGFKHLPEMTPERAVDLGCGGGRAAGFSFVTSDHHPSKPWIMVLARK